MDESIKWYTSPNAMEPLFPEDSSGGLEKLAIDLMEKAAKLSGTMNPLTRAAIADFLRPMNSYYSNLIEGHDTHPIDIHRALNNDFSENRIKRNLQLEAQAHINVHKSISEDFKEGNDHKIPSSVSYLKQIHKRFYEHLPEDFKFVESREGNMIEVIPGEFRTQEVSVGKHIAPGSENLHLFTNRFEEFYEPVIDSNKSKLRRIISIAASHHRFAWIHPFIDGNGRAARLYSDACFMHENIHAAGLWSISRGLARKDEEYKMRLANADLKRINDYDGRGNLSNKMLIEFCTFFLETAIDQVDFMYQVLDTNSMVRRLESFSDLMVIKGRFKSAAKYILIEVFEKGKISKSEAMRITGTSDKTLKKITDSLIDMQLLSQKKESRSMIYYVMYPITFSPLIFPGLYPEHIEIDMTEDL